MADQALQLMQSVQAALEAGMSLTWRATRLETPTYPVGYLNITSSTPIRGHGYYAERHRGVVSVWTKATKETAASPVQAFTLAKQAQQILSAAVLSTDDLTVLQFSCEDFTSQNPDGLTWGRSFIFQSVTQEAPNG
ncbi:hypothetical protein [Paracoccus homiensis]|uniref:DUF3168 domain-containing protein n=1 Tax=Paracoccus homiensis TaxID=364199 RepID=A0A1I0J0K0_9RHOB|nr:hypothetical protein [Paracoccus homiensis]SEU03260.1 hypothetical protein SAMN04489858_12062 [Paracoccus homiensis]